jgi:hypothetical protein
MLVKPHCELIIFIYADQEIVDIKIPIPPPIPLQRGIGGGWGLACLEVWNT